MSTQHTDCKNGQAPLPDSLDYSGIKPEDAPGHGLLPDGDYHAVIETVRNGFADRDEKHPAYLFTFRFLAGPAPCAGRTLVHKLFQSDLSTRVRILWAVRLGLI